MTTGIFARAASATGPTSAASSSGASTIPDTPRVMKPSTSATCDARSSSRSGPRQMMSTPSSCAAFSAPAWMLCQNTCDVPFGMTAIVVFRLGRRDDPHAGRTRAIARATTRLAAHLFIQVLQQATPEASGISAHHRVALGSRPAVQIVGRRATSFARSRRPPCTPASPIPRAADARRNNRTPHPDTDEICRRPSRPVRFGHQARHLAPHIPGLCELADVPLPFPNLARADLRLRQMIEDEPLAREPRHELDGSRQMPRINKDVVGEVEILEQRDAPAERRPQQKAIVGLGLHDVPHADKLGMRRELRQLCRDIVGLQIDPAHDRRDERVAESASSSSQRVSSSVWRACTATHASMPARSISRLASAGRKSRRSTAIESSIQPYSAAL